MNRHFTLSKALSAILLFLGIALGQSAFAQTTWSLQPTSSGNTITYKVKRSGDISQAVTVRYRTVGLSSYEGENFTSANGTLTFPAGIDQQTVTVTTQTPSTEAYKYYQSGATRKYLFEVTDMGGFSLVSKEDNAGAGTVFNTSYLNQSVTDLVYFTYNGAIQSGDGNKYVDASYSSSSWVQVTDGGYSQAVHTISTNNLYSNNSSATSFRSYLNEIGYNMYATVYFTQMEEQDGYQYIQILADNSSTYDGDDPDGAVNAPSTSIYKASFILSYDPSGSVMSDPHYQFFPHRYNYVDRAAEQTAGITHYEFDYDNSHLYQQKFRTTSYQASTSGSLVLAPTVNNLNVRFDAAGSGGDTWDFKNLKVRLALVDATKPKIRNNNDIRVADGAYGYGNTVYITIPFTEIVTVTGSPTLSTSWGELNYVAGSGTNVLTFSGHIEADLGTVLTINSIGGTSFTIKDLMGNTYNTTSINKTYSGLQVTNPWAGSGTANDPYIIMDRYQLDLLSKLVWAGNYYENKYFKLGANITYSSSTSWSSTSSFTSNFTSIGGWGHSFRGVFDGDGHSISGIRIYKSGSSTDDECQGLFGYASSATVKNLVLYDANIVGYKQVGAIAGSQTYGTFQDCYIYNTRVAATSGTQQEVIAGSISGGTRDRIYFKNCKIGNNTGQHNIVKLTLTNEATVSRTPVTTVNSTLTTYSDGATISGEEYYSPDATITLGYSGSVPSGSFVKYTASTSTGDITFTNIDGNVLTMPDADVTVSAAILPEVTYLDANGDAHQCSDYTLITSSTSDVEMGASGKTHWYVVSSDATINAMLKFTDATANLILCNGATLNVNRTNSGTAVVAQGLNIFGQTNGNGTLNVTASNGSGLSSHDLGIYGGIVSASGGNKGINSGSNSITLGYTAAANRIYASKYGCASLTVKAGQTLTDGEGNLYSGTYTGDDLTTALTAMATKTLQPAYSITLPNNFTVTGTTAAQGYAPANEVVTLHTDEGYTITGASYTPAGGSATTINPVEGVWSFTMPAANTTVNATRVVNTYTVHFDANATNGIDVTGTMEDMDFTYGQAQNLTTNDFERTGYTFDGWNTAADGSGDAYTDGQNVNNLTNVLNGLVTLYAQWSVIQWQGNGTSENDPYIIIYASQLVKLSEDVNGGNGYSNKFFKLGNDINMSGVAFDGIGSSSARSFGGTFNGDGKTVSNVIVNKSEQDYVGFFGNVRSGGTVKNLILDGVSISGYQYVGALVGKGDSCSIENCLVMNSSVTYTNRNYIGVICGSPNEVSLTGNHYRNCTCNNTQTTNIGVGAFTNSNDVDGARSIHTLALPEHVTASSTDMVTYDNVTYYASNVEVALTPAQGITLADVTVNGVAATHQQDETWTFTMPAADATVTCTSSVPYIDADGNQQTCSSYTVIESSNNSVALGTNGQDGWYVVSGNVTITGQLWLKGTNNHLILCDGASLTINHAIQNFVGLYVANNLYIYGQSAGSGTATITIASPGTYGIQTFGGNLTINGGIISATSGTQTSILASSGNLTVNGGSVTAHGYYDGIRSGQSIVINGGTVNATTGGGNDYYGIRASQDITLGFTNLTDRITASSYKADYGTISVKADQALYDGTAVAYSGTLTNTQINAIAGKTLEPCFILTLPAHVNATGVISQDGTTAYALAGNEITLAVTEGYEITSGAASFTMPTHNVVSDVTVQAIAYSISYDLAGGSVATANPTTYHIETATFTLNNPTREGYTFLGWTGTDLNGPTMNVTIAQGSIGDRSYTANWRVNILYVDANGNLQTCTDYTLVGSSNANVTYGTDGQECWFVVNGDVTITGKLTLQGSSKHLILCDGATLTVTNSGDNHTAISSQSSGSTLSIYGQAAGTGILNATTTDNHSDALFHGGSLFINGGHVNAHVYGTSGSFAIETSNNITVNGGSVQATGTRGFRTGNGNITLGWRSLSDRILSTVYSCNGGSVIVKAGQRLTDGTAVYSGTLTSDQVTAIAGQTLQPCFAITLPEHVAATGIVSQEGTTAYALAGAEITLAAVEGYEITDGTTSFTMPAQNVVSDVTVQIITYNITYDLAGGTVATANPTTYNIETATFTLNNPTREHYTFTGWTGTDLDEPTMNVTITQGSIGDRSYTANWTPITYNIAYDLAGGSVATANPTTYNIETATFTLNNPTRQGYTFVGWTGTDLTEPTQTVTIAQGSIGDRTYTATWDRLERYYTFDSTTGELALIWGEYNKDNKWGNDVTPSAVTSVTATSDVSFTGDCYNLFYNFTNCMSMDLGDANTDALTSMFCMFYNCSSLTTLDLSNWNTASVTNMGSMFYNCSSLTTLDVSEWNTASVYNMDGLFYGCSGLESLDVSNWNTASVTNMGSMFYNCSGLTTLDVSNFNTASVTNMGSMFYNCSGLTTLDVSNFNTASVTNMSQLFYGCSSLTTLDVSEWNTASVTNMGYMFYNCSSLTTLDVSNFDTGNVTSMFRMFMGCMGLTTLDVSNFNTASVTNMYSMFLGCGGLTTLDVSNFNTAAVTNMGSMFLSCSSLESLDLSNFDTGNVTDMNSMFHSCSSLESLDISNFDTGNVTNMSYMFYNCSSLESLDLSSFDTGNVTNMSTMFIDCSNLTTIYAGSGWSTAKLTAFSAAFPGCTSLVGGNGTTFDPSQITTEYARIDRDGEPGYLTGVFTLALPDDVTTTATPTLVHGDVNLYAGGTEVTIAYGGEVPEGKIVVYTVNGTDFVGDSFEMPYDDATVTVAVTDPPRYVFNRTTGTLTLYWGEFNKDDKWGDDVPAADVLSVTATDQVSFIGDCSQMFKNFSNCTSIDLSQVNTDDCTDMSEMFGNCKAVTTLDLSNWNTANVTNMTYMFAVCQSLESLDVSNWNTASVTDMHGMFIYCSALESLDILNFDIGKVTDMSNMFNSCSGLKSLDLSNWNTAAVTTMNNMFIYCSTLESLDLSGWANSSVTDMTNMFLNCSSLETLDVSNWNTASVTNMSNMFNSCSGLTTLDLSSWNTAAVTTTYAMFVNCSNLTTIYVGEGWNAENVTGSGGMFGNCTSLVGGMGTEYDPEHVNGDYAHIDGGPSNPGYLTAIPLDPVEYIDANGQTAYCQYYTILNGSEDYISYGDNDVEAWYVVDHDVTYSGGIWIYGPANLILVDGATLTINDDTEGDGGYMSSSDRLTIYVQSNGTGAITAVNSSISASGDLIIHGGHIALSRDNDQAYTYMYSSGDMTINGGAISIENGNYHCIYASGQLTINEGTLNAVVTEGYDGYDVIYSEEDVVINGGNITVTNQRYGRGIWGDNVTINGGSVKVYIAHEDDYSGIATDGWGGITLGWTDPSDLIMSEGGYDTYQLSIATGQAFTDGEGNYYFGTYYLYEMPDLAGKTLVPFTNLSETFNITYVTDGGTLPEGYPTTYTFGETVVLPIPTKEDNAFAGWFDNAEFDGYPVTEIVAGTALGNKTFYAKWMPAKTWVEYLDADGQQQRVYATVLYGIETELPGGVYTIVDDEVYFDKLSFTGNTTIILPDDKYLYVECMGKGTNDDEYSLFVNGDLTIYGQEHGDGLFNSYNVQVSGDVAIYGGYHDIGQLSANNGSGTITLSWTGWDSSIRVGVYLGKVVLAKAFIDDDDNIHEAGTVADVTTINGQYLYPFITETEVSYLDQNGVLQTVTATVLYGGEEATYPGGVYTVLEDMVIRGQAYYDRLHFTGDATIIIPDWCSFGVAATKEDNEYWMHVDGDLTIYGQEYGNGECLFSNVTVNRNVNVYGGLVVLYNISANAINLSWTSIQNEHMVNPTQGTTVNLLKDFMYYDDDHNRHVIKTQQGVDIATIATYYLKPYVETIDISYIDENGDAHTENATMLFGDETNLDGGIYTIMNGISFHQAVSFNGDTKLIVPDGTYFYGYYQGGGINLNVNGDLAIYGQENRSGTVLYINASVSGAVTVSNVRVIYSFINSERDILIAGGEHEYGQLSANGTITLGYLTFNDEIYCEDYEGTVAIRAGQTMINYGTQKTYTGTLTAEQITEIEGQYLRPYLTPITFDVAGYGESTESDHWVFIASPIAGSISADDVINLIGGMTPSGQYDYDLYRFNQSASMEWENYHQHNTFNDPFLLENGKGYLYANKNDVTLEFWGVAYPGSSKEVALDYVANSDFAGWNLVGNPFNAPATLDKSYYKMNTTGTGLVAEALSGNTPIDALTGVMVQAEGEDETVLFTKSDAKGQQETGFGTLQIALTQAGTRGNALLDNAIVSFNEGDELGKFYFGTQDANIYIPKNHKEYAIAYAGNQTEMPLNFEAHENGEYTLTISAGDVIARSEATWQSTIGYLHLIDNLTGNSVDLLQTPSYTFTAHTSDYASRFKLVFGEGAADDDDDFAFIDANGNIIINGIDGHATIQLIDLLGHVLVTKQLPTANCSLSTSDFPGGMYLLRLINGDNVKTQKIVIR